MHEPAPPPTTRHITAPRRLGWQDAVCLAIGIATTFGICLRLGYGRLLWEDEVLGWVMLRDPSWRHMFQSWNRGTDGGGALFYITGRLWFAVFGSGNMAFRLYSATLYAAAFMLLWMLVRRFYSSAPAAIAVLAAWFLSPALIPHAAEGRFYGLFLASTLGVCCWIVHLLDDRHPSWSRLLGTWLVFSLLITSHILGAVYACMLVLAWWCIDFVSGIVRPRLYLAALASLLWLLPSWHAIQASAAVGKPHFWTIQPNVADFFVAYAGGSLRAELILALLLAMVAISLFSSSKRSEASATLKGRLVPIILMSALFTVPLIFYIEGIFAAPLFNTRYLQPVEVATVILIAQLVTMLQTMWLKQPAIRRMVLTAAGLSMLLMVLQYDFFYLPYFQSAQHDYASPLTANLPGGVPILCEDAFTFTELMRTESDSNVRYLYLLDWQYVVSDDAPRLEVTQYHLMQNWHDVGYFKDHVVYRDDFLAEYPWFLVMHTDEDAAATVLHAAGAALRNRMIGNPLTGRFAADPRYTVLPFSTLSFPPLRESLSLVCRRDLDCAAIDHRLRSGMPADVQRSAN